MRLSLRTESFSVGFRPLSDLSARWLGAAEQFLQANGSSFRASWGRELADIETRLTASDGAALCTFYVQARVVSSHLLLAGAHAEVERELTEMFLTSLRNVRMTQLVAKGPDPFGSVRTLSERPLEVVVFWAPPEVSDERQEMSHELSHHFVAAFFQSQRQRYS